jgi:hypothetical protein
MDIRSVMCILIINAKIWTSYLLFVEQCLYTRVKILFLLLQQIPSFISNALFLTKVCLLVYNRQSQQRPFYRSRKGDSYGTEVVPKISLYRQESIYRWNGITFGLVLNIYKQTTSRECLQLEQINNKLF